MSKRIGNTFEDWWDKQIYREDLKPHMERAFYAGWDALMNIANDPTKSIKTFKEE